MNVPASVANERTSPFRNGLRFCAIAFGMAFVAGCATPPPPPVPAPTPTPAPVQLIPAKPRPPMGASAMMAVPPVGLDGSRLTVNSNLSTAQTTWNLRSALNVAALNCQDPRYAAILPNYSSFLKRLERALRNTNNTVLGEFRSKHGRRQGQAEYDGYMTKVYNYYALPPAQRNFCDVALAVSNDSLTVDSASLDSWSATALPRIEAVFQDFYNSYDAYERNLANWNATYGPNAVPGTPVPEGVQTGALAPTPGEQVLFRTESDGTAIDTTPPPSTSEPVVVAELPAEETPAPLPTASDPTPSELPSVDPGASAADAPAAAPTTQSGGIVFTSTPVVQSSGEDDDE